MFDERLALRAFCGADRSSLTFTPPLRKAASATNVFDRIPALFEQEVEREAQIPLHSAIHYVIRGEKLTDTPFLQTSAPDLPSENI